MVTDKYKLLHCVIFILRFPVGLKVWSILFLLTFNIPPCRVYTNVFHYLMPRTFPVIEMVFY